MTVITNATIPADGLEAVKARQRAMWGSGDYAVIGTTLQIVGEQLCEALDLRAGSKVLDVAAGNGNATLAAARRWCDVTSTDYVPSLLKRGRERAAAEHLTIEFREADAEALPFADASYDVVLSTFGVMFSPDHARAARELLRVCRPGGRIALACWTPEGFLGQLFKVVAAHVPPVPGVQSPLLWGTQAHVDALFAGAASIAYARRTYTFRYRSPEHFVDVFRSFYGPVHKAFAALDATRQRAFEADLLALLRRVNRAGAKTLVVPAEYLETVVTR
jgi:ubiquinone/menaquinone biosynthesis C-methylase UbiE